MDRPPSPPQEEQQKRTWHDDIMAERNLRHDHSTYLDEPLQKYVMYEQRDDCLILGDASHVVTNGLVEKRFFAHATVVDSDPLVLDEYLLPNDDARFTKILSDFLDYTPKEDAFNFVYGKSVAFIPKDRMGEFLSRIHACLKKRGVLCAILAGEKDTFRPVHYSREEIEELFKKNKFLVRSIEEAERKSVGLINSGYVHEFIMVAVKD